jgi:hypothetical protein
MMPPHVEIQNFGGGFIVPVEGVIPPHILLPASEERPSISLTIFIFINIVERRL